MNRTAIEWTATVHADGSTTPGFSANPLKYRMSDGKTVWACVKTSPGCAHCYSEAIALRWERGKLFSARNMEELTPFLDDAELKKMRTAKAVGGVQVSGGRCFLADMTDLFGPWVPDDLLNRLFSEVLEVRTDVTWQLLTKRADRLQAYLSWRWGEGRIPSRNIHVGVSVEDQQRADERIPLLLRTPAAVRFLSVEPLLEVVDLRTGVYNYFPDSSVGRGTTLDGIHWVIVGGESGHGARPCCVESVRHLVRQCRSASVPVFVKQLGANVLELHPDPPKNIARMAVEDGPGTQVYRRLKLRDGKGGDLSEWAPDLRVREFPR